MRTSIYEHVELVGVDRAAAARTPIKAIEAPDAARAILQGVLRNEAIIVFPPVFRWAWRAYRLRPALAERVMLPRVRQLRRSRTHP